MTPPIVNPAWFILVPERDWPKPSSSAVKRTFAHIITSKMTLTWTHQFCVKLHIWIQMIIGRSKLYHCLIIYKEIQHRLGPHPYIYLFRRSCSRTILCNRNYSSQHVLKIFKVFLITCSGPYSTEWCYVWHYCIPYSVTCIYIHVHVCHVSLIYTSTYFITETLWALNYL